MSEEPAASGEAETLEGFLQQHPALRLLPSGNRVQCTLTGHELPCQLAVLQAYTTSKKYLRLTKGPGTWDYREYEPHIVPSTKNPNQLFCKLTLRHINRTPEQVLHHVRGRRYQKALKSYEECQKEGVEYVPACLLWRQPRQRWRQNKQSNGSQRPHHKGTFWEPPPSDEDGEETDDSMSDLYPPAMFPERGPAKKEASDVFMTDSDEEVAKPAAEDAKRGVAVDVGSAAGDKRGKKQAGSLKKKFKTSAQKTQEPSESGEQE